jgi:hypothetical protein
MEKYIPIKPHNFKRCYNLPVFYLEDFRARFGGTLNNIKEDDFIEWCSENEVILYKFVTNTIEVKIEDY